jgi:hypothetical protein
MRDNSGYLVRITEGVRKDQKGVAYHRDQVKDILAKEKILITFADGKVLVNKDYVHATGFVN